MFNLFKKKPTIYTHEYHITDTPNWQVVQSLKPGDELKLINTSVFYKKSLLGNIRASLVDYLNTLIVDADISVTVKSTNPFHVQLNVSGEWPEAPVVDTSAGPKDKEYHYRVPVPGAYPMMIPSTEYVCSLMKSEDSFLVVVDKEVVAEIKDIGDSKRVTTLERMLSGNKCKTTAQLELDKADADLYVIVRL